MFDVHRFSETIEDVTIYFHVLTMKESFFIWIGKKPARFTDLSMSLPSNVNLLLLNSL